MWVDVIEFYNFYESPIGRTARKVLRGRIETLWPNVKNESLAGYGYSLPYLESFHHEASRILALMPAQMGAMAWPSKDFNRVTLCEGHSLPLSDESINRFLVIHGLEYTEHARALLKEIWRVLIPGGSLLVVVPNRRGLWARSTLTPLGQGRPYTGHQLFDLLEEGHFTPHKPFYSLFTPPTLNRTLLNLGDSLEKYGQRWFRKLGGVVFLEARKQVLGAVEKKPLPWRQKIFVPVTNPH